MALKFRADFAAGLGASPIIITGAGGWLGQAALEMAASAVPVTQIHAFGSAARTQQLRNGASITVQPLAALPNLLVQDAIIFHFAFLTREHAGAMPLAAYCEANRTISALVEAFLRGQGARALFVPSSGAAATADPVHNPYGALKLEDEWRFAALGQEQSTPVVNMRVFNLAGPFINKLDSYALACILRDLLAERPVVLHAARPIWRGYAHVADVLNIALGLMLREESPPVFDSWGEPIELSALAERAAKLLGKPLSIERPEWQNGAADKYLGNAVDWLTHAQALGLEPASLDRQILETADYLST
jgi:nucleoside-diphosphate-sugar epimerase